MEQIKCDWCEAEASNPEHGCKTCDCGHDYERVFDFRIWKLRFIIEVRKDEEE